MRKRPRHHQKSRWPRSNCPPSENSCGIGREEALGSLLKNPHSGTSRGQAPPGSTLSRSRGVVRNAPYTASTTVLQSSVTRAANCRRYSALAIICRTVGAFGS